ncbi:MAG: O-antigen ligase family protein [Actinomycetota bacterium]
MATIPAPTRLRPHVVVFPLVAAALATAVAIRLSTTLSAALLGAAVVGGVAALAIRSNPQAWLLGLAATRATFEGAHVLPVVNVAGNGLSPGDLLTIAFLAGASWYLMDKLRSGSRFLLAPTVFSGLLFMGIAAFSLVYSPQWGLGARDILKFAGAYCAFLVVVVDRPDVRQLRLLLGAIVAGAAIPIAFSFYQLATATAEVNEFYGWARVQSFFDHPNTYGFYLVVILAAVWALHQEVSGRERLLTTCVALAAFGSLAFTLSRNSYAALAILVLVVGWRQRRVLVAAAFGVGAVVLSSPQVVARTLQFFSPVEQSQRNSLVSRLSIWEHGTTLWESNPLLGLGWGATSVSVGKNSHNDYLRSLIEGGVIGLIIYIALVAALVRLGWRASRGRSDGPRALLGLAIAYAVVSLASNTLGKGVFQFHFWLVAGILYVWGRTIPPSVPLETGGAGRPRARAAPQVT